MLPTGVRVYVACGVTDLRKGFDGLAALIQPRWNWIPIAGRCSCSGASAAI